MANLVLIIHLAWVTFVVALTPLIMIGGFFRWRWIHHRGLRRMHVGMMLVVTLETLAGLTCPLTTLENNLRRLSGGPRYEDDFVAFWLRRILYWDFEPWVFTVVYVLFFALILVLYRLVPPRRP